MSSGIWDWLSGVLKGTSDGQQITETVKFSTTGGEKKMETPIDAMILNRNIFTDKSTVGELYLDGEFQCFTLELSARAQEGVKNCIPAGRYEIQMQYSARFEMDTPHLQNVPGRTFIEIHPGNKPADTEGCILLGQGKDTDWVSNSRAAYQALIPKIEAKLAKGKFYIEIAGNA